MRLATVLAGCVGVATALAPAGAGADSLDDFLGPREIAMGEAMRGGATGMTGAAVNPAGIPLNRELVFEGGYGYRSSDSASIIGASACDSTNSMPGCFFYQYAGSSPDLLSSVADMDAARRTHLGGLALSKVLVPRILIGATAKYFNHVSSVIGEQAEAGFAFDAGGTVRVTEMINLGIAGQNLVRTADSTQFPRALGGGIHARPIPLLAIGFDARWRLEGEAQSVRYGGGAELFLRGGGGQMGFPIRLGGVRDNNGEGSTYVSAGLGLTALKWGIDVTGRMRVKGGDETLVIASMRFWGPRMASPGLDTAIQ